MASNRESRNAERVTRNPNLWLLFAVTMMAVGNVSSVSPAFPGMMEVFGIDATQIGWVVTAYSLPGVVSAPLVGVMADRIGRKRILVPTLVLFAVSGGTCAFAGSFAQLLALRAVQGMAASPLVALSITIIGDLYEGRERATAIGYNATALSVSTAAYPALGGVLAGIAWNWPFALPWLALPVAALVAWKLDAPEIGDGRSLTGYLQTARRYLLDRRVVGLLLVNFGFFILLFGAILTYVPELLDTRFGAAPSTIGLLIAVASLVSGAVATQLGRISAATSLPRLVQGSLVLIAAALALFPLAPGLWAVALVSALFGLGQGLNQPALQTRLTDLVPSEARGVVLSMNGTILRLGQAVGPLATGAVLAAYGVGAVFYASAAAGLLLAAGAAVLLGGE
jgi:predicted MFS family arabinose efflux permease